MAAAESMVRARVVAKRPLVTRTIKTVVSFGLLLGTLAILISRYDFSSLAADFKALTPAALAIASFGLLTNALMASLRFKAIAQDMGYRVSFGGAMRIVSASSLAGALFFQLAGQLIARGAMMSRGGVPFPNVVVITLYERVVAAILSTLIAIAGAYFVFGRVYIDANMGGAVLVKLVVGLVAATTVGALIGYGKTAAKNILPLLSRKFGASLIRVVALTILVQLPMMAGYVTIAHVLSPATSIIDLIAASAIVMFAASIPISLAGWGVREMSAVAALGFIGVSAHAAFATAIFIGFGSLVAMGVVAAASLSGLRETLPISNAGALGKINYARVLAWAFPLAVATLVPFQVYVPVGTGLLNVNLADPVALIGASLVLVSAVHNRKAPLWRAHYINRSVILATLVLTVSLLIGIETFGLTDWAWINRYLGWFVLLSYSATGALIIKDGGEDGLKTLTLTYVGALIAISTLDMALLALNKISLTHSPDTGFGIDGFSQNHNSFAFQLLMSTCAIIVLAHTTKLKAILLSITFAAIWFSGSRSGWLSLAIILVVGLYIRAISIREIVRSVGFATIIAAFTTSIAFINHFDVVPRIVPNASSTNERMLTWLEGYKLFVQHPLFGAGLGAFRNLNFLSASAEPLIIHSTGLWLLAELGVVGFLTFFIPFTVLFFREWKSAGREQVSAFIVLCFTAFALMCIPADMLYQRTFWLFIGAAVALLPNESIPAVSRTAARPQPPASTMA